MDIHLAVCYRYLDDCITAIPKDNHEIIKQVFNS